MLSLEPPKNKAKARTPIFDEHKDDLLTKNFKSSFDDDLKAIFAIGFVRVILMLPMEYSEVQELENLEEDCYDIFPGREC